MGRITKEQVKRHDETLALLSLTRDLTSDEREFVYRNYNPMAEHNVTKNAIFFTPYDLAGDFTMWAAPKGRIIDLGAGIGILAHRVLEHDRFGGGAEIREMVALEINPEFVEVGRKLLPDVKWCCRDMFARESLVDLGFFDAAISNPPFGHIPSSNGHNWLRRAPAHFMALEVALRIAYNGGIFIFPDVDVGYDLKRREYKQSLNLKRFRAAFPGANLMPKAQDLSCYRRSWLGVAPRVVIADLYLDDVEFNRPLGLDEISK
jgi:phospholipid N-methyltransferase